MSSTDYSYDEQGQFFPFFVLTLSSLVTIPLTYGLVRPKTDLETRAPRIQSSYRLEEDETVQRQKTKSVRRERPVKRVLTVIIGYALMAYMTYLIAVTARTTPRIWNPYDILGISQSADERAIGRHYKRLSMVYHPDKLRPDPAKNETTEALNAHFIELTKAYKALTDEETRNNYIQYGHPDGKQSMSIGIALPKFIVTEGNGKYVLLVYGALLGLLLPHIVGKWWYGSQRYTREKIFTESAGSLFHGYKEDIEASEIVGVLSSAAEYQELLQDDDLVDQNVTKTEKSVLQGLLTRERELLLSLDNSKRRLALSLLWAYLQHTKLDNQALEDAKFAVAPVALTLNDAFTSICLAFGILPPAIASYHSSQNIIQALLPGSSPLLQLPHFNDAVVRSIEGPGARKHWTIQQFMQLSNEKRRSLCVGPQLLDESQYENAIGVARQLPHLQVVRAFFKVVGEKFVTPNSLVQFVIKARFVPPASESIPEVTEEDTKEEDADEDDVDAFLGRKQASEQENVQPPLAHAPYFARDHSPRWYVFMSDAAGSRLCTPPTTTTTFSKPIYAADGKPTFAIQTLTSTFQAPPTLGEFKFLLHMICDSYIGFDDTIPITLVVDDPAKAVDMTAQVEDDISEPEEDSLAGQMMALKTGQVPQGGKPKKRVMRKKGQEEKKKKQRGDEDDEEDEDSSSDESSDTDGEVEDDDSETDTETEDES